MTVTTPRLRAERPERRRAMTTCTRTRRRRMRGESGFVLATTGLMLIPLLVFTAFAVDLGSWYAQGAEMQRAIDAAALAGVVQLPDTSKAQAAADSVLKLNGFDPAIYRPTYSYPSGAGQQMSITLQAPGKQYFSQIVMNGQRLTRRATAVYNLRIPLGSPSNVFGDDPFRGPTSPQPNLWAAIQGPYTLHANGDPYATKCAGSSTSATSCGSPNPQYDPNGYIWAVEVPPSALNQPITVSIYDPAQGPTNCTGSNQTNPCPSGRFTIAESTERTGFATSYQLFNTTGTSSGVDTAPANAMNTLGMCSGGTPGYKVFAPGTGALNYPQAWYPLCTFTPTVAGIYPLQVKSSAIPGVTDRGGGWNVYSVGAVSSGPTQPSVYAIDKMSIWTPTPAADARFYLANIGPQYAGHTLVVDLFDPGDGRAGNAPFTMQFMAPPSGSPAIVPTSGSVVSCNYNATPSVGIGPPTPDASANCAIKTLDAYSSNGIYNDRWLRVAINIPATYSCSGDCWWTVKYAFGNAGAPTDRTVWVVNVLGDPVHLVQ